LWCFLLPIFYVLSCLGLQAHQQEVAAAAACRHTLMSALHEGEAQLEGLLRALQEQLGTAAQPSPAPNTSMLQ
jgi:hypothetical protein